MLKSKTSLNKSSNRKFTLTVLVNLVLLVFLVLLLGALITTVPLLESASSKGIQVFFIVQISYILVLITGRLIRLFIDRCN